MLLNILLGLAFIVVLIAASNLFTKKNSLENKIKILEKELDIQMGKLNYQKKHHSDSENYSYSVMLIVTEMLNDINNVLKSEEGDLPDKILKLLFSKANNLFNPAKSCVFLKTESGDLFRPLSFKGFDNGDFSDLNKLMDSANSFLGWSISTGRFLSSFDAAQDPILSHIADNDPLGLSYVQPFKVNDQVLAVFAMGDLDKNIKHDAILRVLSILSDIASVSLSNAMLTQKFRDMSIKDS